MAADLNQLPDDDSPDGRYVPPEGGVGPDHPMRNVTRQVAFEGGWSPGRAAKVAGLFDSMAEEWDASHSDAVRTAPIRDALRRGGLNLGGRWLELGAGTGAGTRILAPAVVGGGGSLVAIDLALGMLRNSPERVAPLTQADASRLPFGDGAFDGLAMVNMLLFPEEVARVLAPGGSVLWVNTFGDRTPIHLPPEDVAAALPGEWSVTWAHSGNGFWALVSRSLG